MTTSQRFEMNYFILSNMHACTSTYMRTQRQVTWVYICFFLYVCLSVVVNKWQQKKKKKEKEHWDKNKTRRAVEGKIAYTNKQHVFFYHYYYHHHSIIEKWKSRVHTKRMCSQSNISCFYIFPISYFISHQSYYLCKRYKYLRVRLSLHLSLSLCVYDKMLWHMRGVHYVKYHDMLMPKQMPTATRFYFIHIYIMFVFNAFCNIIPTPFGLPPSIRLTVVAWQWIWHFI